MNTTFCCFIFAGSGNVLPHSIWGRVISIFYIMVGFFIMLIYLAVIGEYLGNSFRQIYSHIIGESISIKKHPESILNCAGSTYEKNQYAQTSIVPIWLIVITLVIYITGGAFMFNSLEEWTLLDSWYFSYHWFWRFHSWKNGKHIYDCNIRVYFDRYDLNVSMLQFDTNRLSSIFTKFEHLVGS